MTGLPYAAGLFTAPRMRVVASVLFAFSTFVMRSDGLVSADR